MAITWRSPSNIALVKYWGKHGVQLPRNPSVSFTLSSSYSQTSLAYQEKEDNGQISTEFVFEDKPNAAFKQKIDTFLESILEHFPFLTKYHLHISSFNSFPHSAGIASSASSMSALALCLCSMEREISITLPSEDLFYKKASYISRLGSGSACRSVYPKLCAWGAFDGIEHASDEYGVDCSHMVDPIFHTFHDDIMIISKQEKSVSSRAGHALMEGNPFADIRYQQANSNLSTLMTAMKEGDLSTFGQIVEQEALQLHALMMTSNPSYILMEANSVEMIKRIRTWREKTNLPLYFSLDAGPNLHLLYPDQNAKEIQAFIESSLLELCQDGKMIADKVGEGPIKL